MKLSVRVCAVAAVGGLVVVALPGHAATAKPQIVDPTGDANGINGQFLVDGVPTVSTGPADFAPADITTVTFTTTFVTKIVKGRKVRLPSGFTVTMALAAAPTDPEVEYRVIATTPTCDELFFEYGTDVATGGSDVRCPATPPAKDVDYPVGAAVVKGNTIRWTVPIAAFPAGTTLSSLNAETRFNPAVLTAPAFDEAASSATFTVGK